MRKFSPCLPILIGFFHVYGPSVWSFSIQTTDRAPAPLQSSSSLSADSASASNYDAESFRVDPASVHANDLRSIKVTNANGELVPLGGAMGNDDTTSIVVFLRHLGCSWCWSYVQYWEEELQKQRNRDKKIVGPIYVSIGDPDRLNGFLEKHPYIPRDTMFVDGYDFSAYKEAGFGRFDEKPKEITDKAEAKPLRFGGLGGWWTFLSNFMQLAPVTEDMKFPEMFTPPGLFWVGGTFVVRGDDIIYRWDDRISGDHPEASEVLAIAQDAAAI